MVDVVTTLFLVTCPVAWIDKHVGRKRERLTFLKWLCDKEAIRSVE
jgi:hypothetical protein